MPPSYRAIFHLLFNACVFFTAPATPGAQQDFFRFQINQP